MRAKASWPPEQDFYSGRLLRAHAGRTAAIVEALRERQCPELARPQDERSIIGRFIVGVLAGTGWRPRLIATMR